MFYVFEMGEYMNLEFREATFSDIEKIIKLTNECFNENTDLKYAQKIYNENKNDKNQIYIVGVIENKVVAHAKINIIPTMYEPMGTYAILNHICVDLNFRRNYIGTSLLDVCFKVAKERNCKSVSLWSKNFRDAAHGLYHKYGFKVVDAKFFEKNID